jgi:CRP/FNR family transcriptional regulator
MLTTETWLKENFEASLLAEMDRLGKHAKVPQGQVILDYGDPIVYIPIVLSGMVKVSRIEEDGRELLLYYISPSESCAMTFTCCMQATSSEIRAVAEEETQLWFMPAQVLDDWISKYPTWKTYVLKTIRLRFNELLRTIDQIAFQNLDQRLVQYLKEKKSKSGSALVNLSHEQIANDLASSRVVISRLLKKLELDGKVLLFRNQLKILKELE